VPTKKVKQPLTVTHPELVKEIKVGDASLVSSGSDKEFTWCCRLNHEWVASVGSRALRNTGCPYCAGTKILKGFNDLETLFPTIAKQASGWDPSVVSPGSHLVADWVCELGHTWKAKIQGRVTQAGQKKADSEANGCPFCWGRKTWKGFNDLSTTHPTLSSFLVNPKDAESISKGSAKKVRWKCKLQHEFMKPPVAIKKGEDPGCPICHGTVVQIGFNDLKSQFPKIASELMFVDPESITFGSSKLCQWKCNSNHQWKARVGSRTFYNLGCPYCSGVKILKGLNDLETLLPELAKEAVGWSPSDYGRASKSKVEWRCDRNHLYFAVISDRAIKKSGCPYCSGNSVLAGFNDLATLYPDLALQADGWNPTTVSSGSGKNVGWICELRHRWNASPQSRALHQTGCPTCANSGFDPNEPGYLYFLEHPDWEMYQIGITNLPDRRLTSHRRLGWRLLELRGPMDGHLTQQWETAILRMLKTKGADLSNEKIAGKFDGYSEAWSKSTFEVKSIKELMRLTEEFEG
jgi:hypothetical protein